MAAEATFTKKSPVRVFVSYAYDDSDYRLRVKRLATRLCEDGVDVRLDEWDLRGLTIPEFMNREVRHADKVLVLCSPAYRTKVHAMEDGDRTTGVGWESMLVTSAIWSRNLKRDQVEVVLFKGGWEESAPTFLQAFPYVDLSDANHFEANYLDLLRRLTDNRELPPLTGSLPQGICADPIEPLREIIPRPLRISRPGLWRRIVESLAAAVAFQIPSRRYFRIYRERLLLEVSAITLLGRSSPVDLERCYVGLRMSPHQRPDLRPEPGPNQAHDREAMNQFVRARDRSLSLETVLNKFRLLILLGEPGSGKTTLLRHLALRAAKCDPALTESLLQEPRPRSLQLLPILITLNDVRHDSGTPLFAAMVGSMEERGFRRADLFLHRRLARGECLCLFDGLDEVSDLGLQERLVREIEILNLTYPGNHIVITSRIGGFQYLFRAPFTLMELADLAPEQIGRFVKNWFAEEPSRSEALMAALEKSSRIRLLAANPLLLSVIALVYELDTRLPARRVELYERCIWVLTEEWERLKGLGERRKFSPELTVSVLEDLGFRYQHDRRIILDTDRLRPVLEKILAPESHEAVLFLQEVVSRTGLIRQASRNTYGFAHLTIQEFLAARFMHRHRDREFSLPLDDPWWRETILLLAGLERDATRIVKDILADNLPSLDRLLVAVQCLTDGDCTEPILRETVVKVLIERLKTSDDERVARGLGELADALGDDDWSTLSLVLQDQEPSVRARIVRVMKAIGDARSAEALAEAALRDDEPDIRATAATALGEIGSDTSIAMIVRRAEDQSYAGRMRAIEALGYAGGEVACRSLCAIIANRNESRDIRWAAANALATVTLLVPAGEFVMGGTESPDERPVRKVFVDDFWIDRYPVTNAHYARFVQETGHGAPAHWEGRTAPPGLEGHPVVNMTWNDAVAFATWCGKRLPAEAEWEKAARGADGRRWPWGDEFIARNCNTYSSGIGSTSPVGSFPLGDSPYGISDMIGNVWEWTADTYAFGRFRPAPESDKKVVRGASYQSADDITRCSYRNVMEGRGMDVGFRCVKNR